MSKVSNPLSGSRRMKPTKRHRLAVWEGILGTVYAANDAGTVRYFDYDWERAREFAGVAPERDPRTWRVGQSGPLVRKGQLALYVLTTDTGRECVHGRTTP